MTSSDLSIQNNKPQFEDISNPSLLKKIGQNKSIFVFATGAIISIGGAIGTILLYSRVGYIALSLEGASLLISSPLIIQGAKMRNQETKEKLLAQWAHEKHQEKLAARIETELPRGIPELEAFWSQIGVEWSTEPYPDAPVGTQLAKLPIDWKAEIADRGRNTFIVDEQERRRVKITHIQDQPWTAVILPLEENKV